MVIMTGYHAPRQMLIRALNKISTRYESPYLTVGFCGNVGKYLVLIKENHCWILNRKKEDRGTWNSLHHFTSMTIATTKEILSIVS